MDKRLFLRVAVSHNDSKPFHNKAEDLLRFLKINWNDDKIKDQ